MNEITAVAAIVVGVALVLIGTTIITLRAQRHVKQAHETIKLQGDALREVTHLFINELQLNTKLEAHHEEHIAQRKKDIERITKADLRWMHASNAAVEIGLDLTVLHDDYIAALDKLPEPDETVEVEPSVIGEQLAAQLKREIAAEEEHTVKDIFALADAVNENMD